MYVPASRGNAVRRAGRFMVWKAGDAAAAVLSHMKGFAVPDEPLQPFIQKIPMLIGTYERDLQAVLRSTVGPGMVVVDGGAHVGYFTRVLSRLVGSNGRVLAYEAHPANAALLRRNTAHLTNVHVHDQALGSRDGDLVLFQSSGSAGHSLLSKKPGLSSSGVTVRVRSIPSILSEYALDRIDFLKLDVEGNEKAVIDGMASLPAQARPAAMVLEVKRYILEAAGTSPEEVIRLLWDLQMKVKITATDLEVTPHNLARLEAQLNKANLLAIT